MNQPNPPLIDLFIKLREEANIPLTIDQYHLLLQALKGGFGITNRDELKKTCALLWLKSPSSPETQKFHQYFDEYFTQLDVELPPQPQKPATKDNPPEKPLTPTNQTIPKTPLTPSPTSKTPLQTPIAIRGEFLPPKSAKENQYQLTIKDLPISPRQIQRNFSYLRRPIPQGNLAEIDIEATVQQISQDGIFLAPVLMKKRINKAELLLLIDISNSMIPCQPIYQRFVDSLEDVGLAKVHIYYFRNIPKDYLYFHPQDAHGKPLAEILAKLSFYRTFALIISDGGAARGGMNRQRIELTDNFLQDLSLKVGKVAWLNPMPEERWTNTTAEGISQFISMFELNSWKLKAAIR
ncbi:MAG TPA: hypothetical protein DEG17_11925 [Cyanobacteria bacterium UBA11149]|nr:hypothetical protein [Cyanobacteria bacterium UBA11367]HBE56301.1 hypothetical protein [Cyanobacteria bacterium UBA11366]HBK65541.1 hypothetical protein [Cyanobacteria bacterium UBA11166]HBR74996.1 hypothetical protein [Cyanobacteria bacterium UBA11159]HBS70822.1 hypothetical protein [Cyanobacteria bacterium UBA11153]HBW89554.1 hypothetical protein [Cyanobacteria bacterium UBA11149]HCA94009.1 hypothetical protein [Cyanobacteria bacterium UBA9226]